MPDIFGAAEAVTEKFSLEALLEGLSNAPASQSNQLAHNMAQKLKDGQEVSQEELKALQQANQQVAEEHRGTNAQQVQQIMAQLQPVGTKNAVSSPETAESQTVGNGQQKDYISMEDYANSGSPVWNNVDYADDATKKEITQKTHEDMVAAGAVVTVPSEILEGVDQALPDLRSMKKSERTPILKAAVKLLKDNLRQFLSGFSGQKFEFSVSGKILEARLYSTGINEVLEKMTKQKANMLYSTEDLFRNARYLYSTQDYNGDPNVYRWNYFYTPVQIGNDTVGVRIAVRDMVKGTDGSTPESQIYNWGIKKDASLGGIRDGSGNRKPYDASSDASNVIIDQGGGNVNTNEQNGGNVYAESTGAGDRVLTGGGQRDAGVGAGEPGRGVAGGTGTAKSRTSATNSGRAIVDRQNRAKDLVRQGLIQPVSSKELGLPKGTDVKNISVLPQEHWDAELQQIAQEVYDETGKEVTFIVGKMQVRYGQTVSEARGARTQQSIIVQVDNAAATPEQIARHEIFHDKIRQNLWLMTEVRDQVLENHTQAELTKVVSQYAAAWGQAMTVTDDTDLDRLMWKIEEEVYADAYAGINYKGAGATRFTESVQQYARQQDQRKVQRQNNGVRQTNGPNAEQNGANAYQNADFAERNTGFAEQTDDAVYSLSESFNQELQNWFDTTTHEERKVSGKRFLVGTTSDVLRSIGVKDYDIYFGGAKIDKILTDNVSMSLDTIKEAVRLLEDPILIMASLTVDDSIVLFGEVYTDQQKPVMISVLLNPKTRSGEVLDYAVITSAYGRRLGNIQNLINRSKIYYVNEQKNRTDKWLKALGLQLPSAITKYGSINSISEMGRYVNMELEKQHGESDDIRYSMDEGDISRIDAEKESQMKQWEEMWLRDQLGEEGAKEYRAQKTR